jgi:hypothetical protein
MGGSSWGLTAGQSLGSFGTVHDIGCGDLDGDGAFDVGLATSSGVRVFGVSSNALSSAGLVAKWNDPTGTEALSLGWIDHDGDGDDDLVTTGSAGLDTAWTNHRLGSDHLPDDQPSVALVQGGDLPPRVEGPGATAAVSWDAAPTVVAYVQDFEGDPLLGTSLEYSADGGNSWQTATWPASNSAGLMFGPTA